MAVQSDTSRIQYAGNNSTTTSYAVPFVFQENSHLKAIARTSAGVESVVTLTNHTGAGNVNGGTVRTSVAIPARKEGVLSSVGGAAPSWQALPSLSIGPVIATGSTTARSVQDRFADVVNIKDFGAVGDGVADDTAAIQAAIDANPSKAIYFPSGSYKITSQIRVKKIWTALIGDASGTRINVAYDSTSPAILVKSDTAPQFPAIFGFQMENLGIWKTVANNNTASIGVELHMADAVKMHHCEIVGFANDLLVLGGRNNYYSNLRLSAFNANASTWPVASSTLKLSRAGTGPAWAPSTTYAAGDNVIYNTLSYTCTVAHTSGASFDASKWLALTGFTHMFENCIIDAGFALDYAVTIESNDYASFANCYLSAANVAIVKIGGTGDYVYDNWFDHCYLDGARSYADGPSPLGVWIVNVTEPTALQNFTDCSFGQMDSAIFIDDETVTQVGVVGCRFNYCYEAGITVSSNAVDFRLVGCAFQQSCTALSDKSLLALSDAKTAVVSGNTFNFDAASYPANTRAILLSSGASINSLSVTGNTFDSASANVADIVDGGATITKYVVSGNASNNATNTAVGHIVGNTENSNANALDWYQEGTWTPTLEFDGATTAITYSAGQRTGSFTRVGNRVYFDCYFLLTNKGSASGAATISGLPFSQNAASPASYTVSVGAMAAALGDANVDAGINSSDVNEIRLYKQSGGSRTNMTEADFENSTNIVVTGAYRV
jgi:hypothetical protein